MKIHSSVLVPGQIHQAARTSPGVFVDRCEIYGSRSRANAFDVALESDGTPDKDGKARRRKRNPGTAYGAQVGFAASYADWGRFLAALFEIDPKATAGPYASGEDFHAQTNGAFRVSEVASLAD